MRRLLFLVALLVSASTGVFAQNNDSFEYDDLFSPKITTVSGHIGDVERFHGRLMFPESNTTLSARDVTNDFWKKYCRAQRFQYYGRYLWTLGLSYMASDLAFNMLYENRDILKDPSFLLGGLFTLIGGSFDFGGWKALGNLADTYNSDPSVKREYTLNFGPTSSGGIGLSLNF